MGSLRNIDFGVFGASWGSSGKEPGSANRFRPGSGFRRFRSQGSESSFVFWKSTYTFVVWNYTLLLWKYTFVLWRGTDVRRKFTFVLWKYTFVLWRYTFVLWKVSFVLWKSAFVLWNIVLFLKVYSVPGKYTFVLWKYYTCVLWKYAFLNWKCSFGLWKYTFFALPQCLLQVAFEHQYSQGKEKVVSNVHFIHANLHAVGDTNCLFQFCHCN